MVVAFGRLIKPHVLERLPMVNVHFSLLPRWRGAAPVERAILAGDAETGVCLMALEEGLDTGPVYACVRVPIGPEETADELRGRLVAAGTDPARRAPATGLGDPAPQVGEPTYASKVDADELHIDWSRPADELHRLVRVGRAWTTFRGQRLRVLRARPWPTDRPGPGCSTAWSSAPATGPGSSWSRCSPKGKAAAGDGLAQRRPPGAGRALGG